MKCSKEREGYTKQENEGNRAGEGKEGRKVKEGEGRRTSG